MTHTDTKRIKARQPHRCSSCAETIDAGTVYARWVTFDDGAETNKMHEECLAMHENAAIANSEPSWEYEHHGHERPIALAKGAA